MASPLSSETGKVDQFCRMCLRNAQIGVLQAKARTSRPSILVGNETNFLRERRIKFAHSILIQYGGLLFLCECPWGFITAKELPQPARVHSDVRLSAGRPARAVPYARVLWYSVVDNFEYERRIPNKQTQRLRYVRYAHYALLSYGKLRTRNIRLHIRWKLDMQLTSVRLMAERL